MEVIRGSVKSNGNGARPPAGGGDLAAGEKGRGAAKGRQGPEKQTMAKKPKVVHERLDEMVRLHNKAAEAAEAAKEAIAKTAEDSGYLASAVKKIVSAKAGEKFEEKHREVEQQAELFDEVAT